MTPEFIERFLKDYFGFKPNYLYINGDGSSYPYAFFSNDTEQTSEDSSDLQDMGEFESHEWEAIVGASKLCIVFEDLDEVIKIPFDGNFNYDSNNELYFIDFRDYIRWENDIYECSSYEMQKVLLHNNFVMRFGGLNIYTQMKIAKSFQEKYYNLSYRNVDMVFDTYPITVKDTVISCKKRNREEAKLPNIIFLADIAKKYPKESCKIIKEMNFEDLHEANYGYLKDGSPVCFDYCGFDD